MDYCEVSDVLDKPGLRIVLTKGLPGPWGLAAKALFEVKQLGYLAAAQYPGGDNSELLKATGQDSAPVVLYNNERARTKWEEILVLAERLAPEPSLIPEDLETRSLMFGLIREIVGENGFGWLRRLMMFQPIMGAGDTNPMMQHLCFKYGYTDDAASSSPQQCLDILAALASRLKRQKAQGSRYFIGNSLTALDVYWAVFCSMLLPLPQSVNPMPPGMREGYEFPTELLQQVDPILIEHRDMMYQHYLSLPLDY